jgi:hypothetical protein
MSHQITPKPIFLMTFIAFVNYYLSQNPVLESNPKANMVLTKLFLIYLYFLFLSEEFIDTVTAPRKYHCDPN